MDLDLDQMFEVFEKADSTIASAKPIVSFDPTKAPGVSAPTNFYDPFNLSGEVDEETFRIWQEAETKHSRVSERV